MNDRIRELWERAAESAAAFPSGQNNSWETQVNFLEKFAELIVRECCDVLFDNELGGYQVNYVLKEHFGVEE